MNAQDVNDGTPIRIGFIGLGAMGLPMARNLAAAGHAITGFDVNQAWVADAASWGARVAGGPGEAATGADLVITMLPSSSEVETAILGSDGVLGALEAGATVIDMSTIDPAVTRKVAAAVHEKGGFMLDAPVGRTSKHAEEGTLAVMVGGDADLFERWRHVLAVMGSDITYCGSIGAGEVMKLVNNLLTTSIVAANAEALALGVKAGLDVDVMLGVLRSTAASNRHLEVTYAQKALSGDLTPGFATRLASKDLGLVLDLARQLRQPVPVGATASQVFSAARSLGHDDDDYTSALSVFEHFGHVEVRER